MEWTNVKDALPNPEIRVLCYSEEGYISVEERRLNERFIFCDSTDSGYATHWMPLPEKPSTKD